MCSIVNSGKEKIFAKLVFGCLLILGLCCGQSALAVTDYIFFVINGDTTAPALVQGDTLSWGSNCDVGSSVYWEIWYDMNGNSTIDEGVDLILESTKFTDGSASDLSGPDPDGIVLSPEIVLALPVGNYIFKGVDLADSIGTARNLSNSSMVSPPNVISGTISIPGHPAPDAALGNVIISVNNDDETSGIYAGKADINGDYQINILASGTGQIFTLGPEPSPGFVSPDKQSVLISGVVGNIDFIYGIPVDSIYGYLKDDVGDLIHSYAWVECEEQYPGSRHEEVRLQSSRYSFAFGADQLGDWGLNIDGSSLVPSYLIPTEFFFSHDTLGSFQHDIVLLRPDAVIYARITENGGLPAHRYAVQAESRTIGYSTRTVSNSGTDNIVAVPVSTQDPDSWALWIEMYEDDYPIPDGLIPGTVASYALSPGDTIDLPLVSGLEVSGVIVQDPEDASIDWSNVDVGLWESDNKNFNTEVDPDGSFTLYADTGSYFMSVYADGYISDPAYRLVDVTGDTTGLGFTINESHCRIAGTLNNLPLPLNSSTNSVWAVTGSNGLDGYGVMATMDSVTGTYLMYLGDGDWTIHAPYFENYTTPDPMEITIGEAPDTVRTIDLNYLQQYACGDANTDGNINISDAVYIINYIFRGGAAPYPYCAGEADGSGSLNISDAIYIINYGFRGGPPPVDDCCP